jgi:hypothetical protein
LSDEQARQQRKQGLDMMIIMAGSPRLSGTPFPSGGDCSATAQDFDAGFLREKIPLIMLTSFAPFFFFEAASSP